jgi:Protein of unknown function (DUF1549)/Protein of unknown function (DUF1553)
LFHIFIYFDYDISTWYFHHEIIKQSQEIKSSFQIVNLFLNLCSFYIAVEYINRYSGLTPDAGNRMKLPNRYSSKTISLTLILLSLCLTSLSVSAGKIRTQKNKRNEIRLKVNHPVVKFLNEKLRESWEDNEITPSEKADDDEWLRRVYLDIAGHIPNAEEVTQFLKDKDSNKRENVIEQLLESRDYTRNWTTIWTNLTVGRVPPRTVNRDMMRQFFRRSFGRNRPWNEVVYDLISAKGKWDEDGATNYLLAQMSMRGDMGVQATSKTAQLFLGVQLQCTQCHDHPFNDWEQNQFWELNSFFRQTRTERKRKYDAKSGRMVTDYWELRSRNAEAFVKYENRKGEMLAAPPIFKGHEIPASNDTDRRVELAKLISDKEKSYLAKAMVNRMWAHFFGYGFVNPIDDLGPHNQPTHPEILDKLSEEFEKNKFDLKQLIRWICNSEAYQLTSQFDKKNRDDDPDHGESPMFSRMYVKMMEAEQLYDSLIIATNAHKSGKDDWTTAETQRQEWLRQFILAFGTDENDESTFFNGTIPQALMMMNGPLINKAISAESGSYLNQIITQNRKDKDRIRILFLATLNRKPTGKEKKNASSLINSYSNPIEGYQDLFWALLNSNEFIINH